MSEAYTFYAIKGADGEFFSNQSYGGGWRTRPKLWSRKQDPEAVLKYRKSEHWRGVQYRQRFLDASIVQFEVKEIE